MFSKLFGRVFSLPTPEEWAQQHASKASAEDLIEGAVVELIAKDFESWLWHELTWDDGYRLRNKYPYPKEQPRYELRCLKRKIYIHYQKTDRIVNALRVTVPYKFSVNGTEISEAHGQRILAAYEKMQAHVCAVKAEAEKAKAAMEKNERQWNTAEQLLGMKRNEHGALVPVETAE